MNLAPASLEAPRRRGSESNRDPGSFNPINHGLQDSCFERIESAPSETSALSTDIFSAPEGARSGDSDGFQFDTCPDPRPMAPQSRAPASPRFFNASATVRRSPLVFTGGPCPRRGAQEIFATNVSHGAGWCRSPTCVCRFDRLLCR